MRSLDDAGRRGTFIGEGASDGGHAGHGGTEAVPHRRVHVRMPDRLLLSWSEAAERLGVSIRTIERLVAADRLPQVDVERLTRIGVRPSLEIDARAETGRPVWTIPSSRETSIPAGRIQP